MDLPDTQDGSTLTEVHPPAHFNFNSIKRDLKFSWLTAEQKDLYDFAYFIVLMIVRFVANSTVIMYSR